MLGIWKNVEELENSLNLDELKALVDATREKEMRHNRFLAAIQGIDLGESSNAKEKFEEVKSRAEAQLAGVSQDQHDLAAIGIDFEED